jgi:MerR family copper efflux transcriptional regulator
VDADLAQGLTIGRLAEDAGVSIDTVRFYERKGVLPEPPRTPAGYRLYGEGDRWRLGFVLRAKELGFTLREIVDLLDRVDVGSFGEGDAADAVRVAAAEKLLAVADQRRELERTTERLEALVGLCEGGDLLGCVSLGEDRPA